MVDKWLVETELSERWDFYTRANVGEVFPDPVAPLSFDFFETEEGIGATERGFRNAYYRFGSLSPEEFPPDKSTILGVIGGYCYLNASAMRMIGHRAEGMSAKDIDESFFGDAPGVDAAVRAGVRGRRRCRRAPEPCRDRQPGARQPVRRVGDGRDQADPGRGEDRGRRRHRRGDDPRAPVTVEGVTLVGVDGPHS
jgi:hypothetical protein